MHGNFDDLIWLLRGVAALVALTALLLAALGGRAFWKFVWPSIAEAGGKLWDHLCRRGA